MGWTTDPAPAELKSAAEKTLAVRPELAAPVKAAAAEYQQIEQVTVGTVGTMNLSGAKAKKVNQVNIGKNSGPVNC